MNVFRLPLLFSLVLAGSVEAVTDSPPASTPTPAVEQREFAIVVVEMLQNRNSNYSSFDRFDRAFKRLIEKRHWPVKPITRHFDANTPAHATELRIFPKELRQETLRPFSHTARSRPNTKLNTIPEGLRQEMPGEVVFLAWLTLTVDGKEHDFGLVKATYDPNPGEREDSVMGKIYDALAREAAKHIEPILFPKPAAPKP